MSAPAFCRTQLNDFGNNFLFHSMATGKVDCNVAQTSECLELVKGIQLTASQTRAFGGDLSGPTGTTLAVKVFQRFGMVAGIDFVRLHKVDVQRVRDLLGSGWYVVGFVDYGVINDNLIGAFSGAKTYRGVHAIGLAGWKRKDGKRVVWDYDPTFDGRHPGYPLGRQLAPFWLIREALASYAGPNLASGYAVKLP